MREDGVGILGEAPVALQPIGTRRKAPGPRDGFIGGIAGIGQQNMRVRPGGKAEEDGERFRRASGGDHHVGIDAVKGGDGAAQRVSARWRRVAEHHIVERQRRVAQRAEIRHAPARPSAGRESIGDRRSRKIISGKPVIEREGGQLHHESSCPTGDQGGAAAM